MASGYYVYAIVGPELAAGARSPERGDLVGFEESPVRTFGDGDARAVASCLDGPRPAATPANARRHEAIVEALARRGPVLPVRFGTVLADAHTLARSLATRRDDLVADLARLGGKVEFGVLVLAPAWSPADQPGDIHITPGANLGAAHDHVSGLSATTDAAPGPGGPGPGTAYLRARQAEHQREADAAAAARRLAAALDDTLGAHALESRFTAHPARRLLLRATYLVDPAATDRFRAAFGEVRRRHRELRCLLSGPWPPYSFVTAPAETADSKLHWPRHNPSS